MAVLYVVATPIGSLQDLSPRAADTLRRLVMGRGLPGRAICLAALVLCVLSLIRAQHFDLLFRRSGRLFEQFNQRFQFRAGLLLAFEHRGRSGFRRTLGRSRFRSLPRNRSGLHRGPLCRSAHRS